MLKKETAEKIKSFGFDVDKLIAAIKDEAEVDYTVPDVQVFKASDLEARDKCPTIGGRHFRVTKARPIDPEPDIHLLLAHARLKMQIGSAKTIRLANQMVREPYNK